MSAQHKTPGRSGKRARRERALARLEKRMTWLENGLLSMHPKYFAEHFDNEHYRVLKNIKQLKANLARPLRPIPPRQTRKLTR